MLEGLLFYRNGHLIIIVCHFILLCCHSLLGGLTFNFIAIKSCVVAQIHLIDIFVGVVVEENGRASLTLEVDAILFLAGDLSDLDLDLSLLENGLNLSLVFSLLVDLLFNVENNFPGGVIHNELLTLLSKFGVELS